MENPHKANLSYRGPHKAHLSHTDLEYIGKPYSGFCNLLYVENPHKGNLSHRGPHKANLSYTDLCNLAKSIIDREYLLRIWQFAICGGARWRRTEERRGGEKEEGTKEEI